MVKIKCHGKFETYRDTSLKKFIVISSFHVATRHCLQYFSFWHLNVHLAELLMLLKQLPLK